MSDPQSVEPDSIDDLTKRLHRLERRLARERAAREAAEAIGDKGMRDLWLANRELDDRVAERTADLEATLEQLEVATTARDQFLSSLSHEMRTPLNGVLGMLELLEPHIDTAQGIGYLNTVSKSANRLNQLIVRLLDIVELNAGRLVASPEVVSPSDFISEIQAKWQRPALQAGHLLTTTSFFAPGETVSVDVARLIQIVDELVDNAITHGTPGPLQLRFRPAPSGLVVEVQDSGPGLSADQINTVFTEGSADLSAARATEGLGLGLGLSRRIAQALGGDLSVENGDDENCVARLELPEAA